ncbi:MAG: MBL fold metallo-hydrolase [Desulfocucumaceae bacterium]
MKQMLPMEIKFWGVRGSIPSPGVSTKKYGGNTSCVSIHLDDKKTLVLDAGTGIRALGGTLVSGTSDIFMLVTHIHWDHIQGFPFFAPIFQKNRLVYVFPYQQGNRLLNALFKQMDGAHFPVTMESLPSRCRLVTEDLTVFMLQHGFHITRIANNHPGGAYGFRIENEGRSVVYLTDNELYPPEGERINGFEDYVKFCKNSDVLIHDAQYIEEDLPLKHGFGHSLVDQAIDLAIASEVKQLVLFHHDPDRTDVDIDLIQERARVRLAENKSGIGCIAAYEGLVLEV